MCADPSFYSMYRPSSRFAPRTFCPFASAIKHLPDRNVDVYPRESSCPTDRRDIRNSGMKNASISTPPRCTTPFLFACDPKPGAGVLEGFIQVHVCPRRHVAGRQHAETAPHRNGTSPEDSGPAGAELHTAESRRVTAQEGLGNGYIRSKLLPLVDRMTDFLLLFFSCPHCVTIGSNTETSRLTTRTIPVHQNLFSR